MIKHKFRLVASLITNTEDSYSYKFLHECIKK